MNQQKPDQTAVGIRLVKKKISTLASKAKGNRVASASTGIFRLSEQRRRTTEVSPDAVQYVGPGVKIWSQYMFAPSEEYEQQLADAGSARKTGGEYAGRRQGADGGTKRRSKRKSSRDVLRAQIERVEARAKASGDGVGGSGLGSDGAGAFAAQQRKSKRGAFMKNLYAMQRTIMLRSRGAHSAETNNVRLWKYAGKPPQVVDFVAALDASYGRSLAHLDKSYRRMCDMKRDEAYEASAMDAYTTASQSVETSSRSTPLPSRKTSMGFRRRPLGRRGRDGAGSTWGDEAGLGRTETPDLGGDTERELDQTDGKGARDPALDAPFTNARMQRQWTDVLRLRRFLRVGNFRGLPGEVGQFRATLRSPTSVAIAENLCWYFYCRYFQVGSESWQREHLSQARESIRKLTNQLQPRSGSYVVRNRITVRKGMQQVDTFHKYYPSFVADSIFATWTRLFPGSDDLVDAELLDRLERDLYSVYGNYPFPAHLQQRIRGLLFPKPTQFVVPEDSEDFGLSRKKSGMNMTPVETLVDSELRAHEKRQPRYTKESFNIRNLSRSLSMKFNSCKERSTLVLSNLREFTKADAQKRANLRRNFFRKHDAQYSRMERMIKSVRPAATRGTSLHRRSPAARPSTSHA